MRTWHTRSVSVRALVRTVLTVCLLPFVFSLEHAPSAAASTDLTVSSTYTYTVDPAGNTVRVVADMSFRNNVPNRIHGNVIEKAYFTGFRMPVPVEAVHTAATQEGAPLAVTPSLIAGADRIYRIDIAFARKLFYNQTAHILVTYDIIGQAPRATKPTRVNPAYAAFDAFGIADPGQLTVRVVVPPGYTVDTFGNDATVTNEGGNTVYTASKIDQPNSFDLYISARNDNALTDVAVGVKASTFNVEGWPGDDGWQEFVHHDITDGVPALEGMIGQPWPVRGTVDVREAVTPYLYGYAGWFNPTDRQLEIGEDLDSHVLIHELSHAWFNPNWYEQRWITEGLAQTYSALVNRKLGNADEQPLPVDSAAAGHLQLNDWNPVDFTKGASDSEHYAYNAAWFVIDKVVSDVGVDKMKLVFAATAGKTIAYVGDAAPEQMRGNGDWHSFLDLVDELGGAKTADALFATYVAAPDDDTLLAQRIAARTLYHELATAGGAWAPPVVVRQAMSAWHFVDATALIKASNSVLTTRDALTKELGLVDLTIPATDEKEYEAAQTDLASVQKTVDTQLAAATAAVAQRDALVARLQQMGVTTTKQFDASYEASTDDVAGVQAKLADIDATATVVQAATAADAATHTFAQRVGLRGKHVAALLDQARAALANGDTAGARAAAAQATATVQASAALGRSRILRTSLVGGGFLVLVLALAALLTVRRRRRKRRAVAAAAADEVAVAAAAAPDVVADATAQEVDVAPDDPFVEAAGESDLVTTNEAPAVDTL